MSPPPDREPRTAASRSRLRFVLAAAAAFVGMSMWMHWGRLQWVFGLQAWLAVGAVAAGTAVAAAGVAWRPPRLTGAGRTAAAVAVFVASAALLLLIADRQGRDVFPTVVDEYSYAAGAYLMTGGTPWAAGHALPDFFTTSQLTAGPVYASIYFPGTAVFLLPFATLERLAGEENLGVFGGLLWVGPWLATAGSLGLTFRLLAEWADGATALLATVLAFSVGTFRGWGLLVAASSPALLLGLACLFSAWKWRQSRGPGWATAGAFFACWATLCRPVDGLAFALVSLGIVAWTALTAGVTARRDLARAAPAVLLALLPWAALQLSFNRAVTGSLTSTPFSWWNDLQMPGTHFGFGPRRDDLSPQVPTVHFQSTYRTMVLGMVRESQPGAINETFFYRRLPGYFYAAVAHGLLLIMLPAGLLGLRIFPKVVLLAATAPVAVFLYYPYAFYLSHYALAGVPAVSALVAVGVRRWGEWSPRRVRPGVTLGLALLAVAVATHEWPGFRRNIPVDEPVRDDALRDIDRKLSQISGKAVVFISPPLPHEAFFADPVYNLGVRHPDAARVVRAHDLAGRNVELVAYFAEKEPDRRVFHVDRSRRVLTEIGNAGGWEAGWADRFEALAEPWRTADYP